jgi:hypothetical protein
MAPKLARDLFFVKRGGFGCPAILRASKSR